MPSDRTKGYALVLAGGLWFGAVVFVLAGNVILRETPLRVIASGFDKLPSPLQGIAFLASWGIFMLGWVVPIAYSLRLLGRPDK